MCIRDRCNAVHTNSKNHKEEYNTAQILKNIILQVIYHGLIRLLSVYRRNTEGFLPMVKCIFNDRHLMSAGSQGFGLSLIHI